MEKDAVLTERASKKAIQAAGYKLVSFEEGAPARRTGYLFRVEELEARERAKLESDLREDLGGATRVAIDSLGRGTVVTSADAPDAREAIVASLVRGRVAARELDTRSWPALDATYAVAVPGMDTAVEARSVADLLEGVAKVVRVHVDHDAGVATLWLKEPCDALETSVRSTLATASFATARFELRR